MTAARRKFFGSLAPLPETALTRSISDTMATTPTGDELWLFAYGSLIWSPCFTPAETRRGVLHGYRRAFNMWSIHTRGTRAAPGLGLGLEPGDACAGVLHRVSPETRARDIDAIWRREMYTAIYEPRWLTAECDGRARQVLCFVTNKTHPQYAPPMPPRETAAIIARAEGIAGPCRDYLYDLLRSLTAHGIEEPDLDALATLVRSIEPG